MQGGHQQVGEHRNTYGKAGNIGQQYRTLRINLDIHQRVIFTRLKGYKQNQHGILYFEADIDHRALGYATDAMLWMRLTPGNFEAVGRALQDIPECRFAGALGGEKNLVANLVVQSKDNLLEILDTKLAGLGISEVDIVPMSTVFKRASA